jgi:hypothetical protein
MLAADYSPPKEGDWMAREFRFHAGGVRWRVSLPTISKQIHWRQRDRMLNVE